MRVQERIKFKRGMDEHRRTRKLSNIPNSASQQNSKMNNCERKEHKKQ
jgi:hypothetical protein